MERTPHGEAGHLNIFTRDQDSVITGRGKHARVIAFGPSGEELYMRVDMLWGLRMPTEREMLTAARKDQGLTGRWKLKTTQDYYSNGCNRVECIFARA